MHAGYPVHLRSRNGHDMGWAAGRPPGLAPQGWTNTWLGLWEKTRSEKSKFEIAPATVSPCVTGKARTQFEHLLVSDGAQWMALPHPLSFSFVSFRKLSLSKITVAQYIIKIEEQAWFGVWG